MWSQPARRQLKVMTELRGSRVVVRITNTLPPSHQNDAPRGHGIALANVRAGWDCTTCKASSRPGCKTGSTRCASPCRWKPPSAARHLQGQRAAKGAGDRPPRTLTFHTAESAMNILIVDDEPLARQRLRTLLSDCTDCQRTTVAEAGNAGEALALLGPTGGRGFDVLLLDIHMPGQGRAEPGPCRCRPCPSRLPWCSSPPMPTTP